MSCFQSIKEPRANKIVDEVGIYEIESLTSARDFLSKMRKVNTDSNLNLRDISLRSRRRIILSNIDGSTRYYGMRVIDRMFKMLQEEFSDQISHIIVNAIGDPIAFHTAKELGYDRIKY